MLGLLLRSGGIALLFLVYSPAFGQQNTESDYSTELQKLDWQTRGVGKIGDQGLVSIPKDHGFLDSTGSKRFLELQGNPPRDNRYIITPFDIRWFGLFAFENIGYVRDDEKIDPEAILASLKESNRLGQEERKRLGLPPLTLEGWLVTPHYDLQTKRLEWGTKLRTETNDVVVNYTVKILGRNGVMDAILVSDPKHLEKDIKEFKAVLANYSFVNGKQYAEFRTGDKIAEYGLSALIVGGAAAAAMKSGAFKGMAKIIGWGALAAGAAFLAFLKRLFRRAKQT